MAAGHRVRIGPGTGTAVRFGPIVALFPDGHGAQDAPLLTALETLGARDDLDAVTFSWELAGRLAAMGDAEGSSVGIAAMLPDGLVLVLCGAVACHGERSQEVFERRGTDAALFLNEVLGGSWSRFRLVAETGSFADVRWATDLMSGVVPGSAVLVEQQPAPEGSNDPVGGDDPGGRDDVVGGIECPVGHFNHPFAVQCAQCGVSLLDIERRTVMGLRRSLGTLTLEDGTSYELDRDYVIGREPEGDDGVRHGRARPLRLDDPEHQISRVHADVRLVSWDVTVVDRASANGTFVLPPEGGHWQQLESGTAVSISPGSKVSVGRKILTYDW